MLPRLWTDRNPTVKASTSSPSLIESPTDQTTNPMNIDNNNDLSNDDDDSCPYAFYDAATNALNSLNPHNNTPAVPSWNTPQEFTTDNSSDNTNKCKNKNTTNNDPPDDNTDDVDCFP